MGAPSVGKDKDKGWVDRAWETLFGKPGAGRTTPLGGFPTGWQGWGTEQQNAWLAEHDLTYAELLTQEREKGQ